MYLTIIAEIGELLLAIVGIYIALFVLIRLRPLWAEPFKRRRGYVLSVIVLVVLLGKVSEDVIALESGHVDEVLLSWIHRVVPISLTGFFQVLTLSASATAVFSFVGVADIVLVLMRQRIEALMLTSTVLAAVLIVYLVKTAVGRTRPALWETQWFCGSSFPSGHSLTSAALATAACLCVARLWPQLRWPVIALATVWVSLVALSRLVLGVHWPTDVLAAAFAGVLIALAINAAVWSSRSARKR